MKNLREINIENFDAFFNESYVGEVFLYSDDLDVALVREKASSCGFSIIQKTPNSKIQLSDQYDNVCEIMSRTIPSEIPNSINIPPDNINAVTTTRSLSKSESLIDSTELVISILENVNNITLNRELKSVIVELQNFMSILNSLEKLQGVDKDVINILTKIAASSIRHIEFLKSI